MYHFRYTYEVIQVVKGVALIKDDETQFSFWKYGIIQFIISLIAMPAHLLMVLFENRQDIIKEVATHVLIKYFDLELKK